MAIRDRISGLQRIRAGDLVPHPGNWRTHPERQRQALQGVLESIGYADAVLARRLPGGQLGLIDGHLRADLDPDQRIPVLVLDVDDQEALAILATHDPLAAMAGADDPALVELLEGLRGSPDLELDHVVDLVAFHQDLTLAAPDLTPDPEDPAQDQLPIEPDQDLVERWGVERGQRWTIEGTAGLAHVLLVDDWVALQWPPQVAVILTDPPYGIDLDTDFSGMKGRPLGDGRTAGRGNHHDPIEGDAQPHDPRPLIEMAAHYGVRELFLFGPEFYAAHLPAGGSWLVWDKRLESQAEGFGSEFELIWSRDRHERRILRHDWFGLFSTENGPDARRPRLHPAQKPVTLLADILTQWGQAGDVVLDPYLGSGSTILAADQLGRTCWGCEIDPARAAVAIHRLAARGLTPTLADG